MNIYEMDLRQYDPAIGRWVVQDPVTHHEYSPYSAFDNNPAYWSDPSGANSVRYNWGSGDYDVLDGDGKWVGSFDPSQFGDYQSNPEEFLQSFFSLEAPTDNTGGGGDGNGNGNGGGKNKGANNKGVGKTWWQADLAGMSGYTFFGAPIRILPNGLNASSYSFGAINVSSSVWNEFLKFGLTSWAGRHLMHEYGHYLQEKYSGVINYYYKVVPSSLEAFQSKYAERDWTEMQASTLAWIFFNKPEGFEADRNIINYNTISPYAPAPLPYDLINTLNNQYTNHPDYKP